MIIIEVIFNNKIPVKDFNIKYYFLNLFFCKYIIHIPII